MSFSLESPGLATVFCTEPICADDEATGEKAILEHKRRLLWKERGLGQQRLKDSSNGS